MPKESPQVNDNWTKADEAAFAELGIGPEEIALRKIVVGQRKINGRFYAAIDLMLESLQESHGEQETHLNQKLAKAREINEGVLGSSALGGGFGGLSGNPTTPSPWKWKV